MKKFVPFDSFEKGCLPQGKTLQETMQENCNDRLAPEEPKPCSATPCPPWWQPTGVIRCLSNGLVDREEQDGCGNSRWTRTVDVVVWVDTAETTCVDSSDESEIIYMQQVNQCGEIRKRDTGKKCCTPEWVQVDDSYDCMQLMLRIQEQDGCGNTRLTDTGQPVAWVDNSNRRCLNDVYERQEINQCGDLRWVTIGAYIWVDTGSTRCVGSVIEKEQKNQCDTSQWVATDAALVWTDTGQFTCFDGAVQKEQTNQCGAVRWVSVGAIAWTNTGNTRCGPVSTNIENEQTDQCGVLRWFDTGVSCAEDVDPSLPASFGGACYVDSPSASESYFRLSFSSNGSGTTKTPLGSGTSPFYWAPSTVDGADYEIMVTYDFAGSYSGPAEGVWTSLASSVVMKWSVVGPSANAANLTGTVSIRKVGNTDPDTTAVIEDTFVSVGVECP